MLEEPRDHPEPRKILSLAGAGVDKDSRTFETRFDPRGWAVTPTRQKVVPEPILCEIGDHKHKATHWSTEKLSKDLQKSVTLSKMAQIVQSRIQQSVGF